MKLKELCEYLDELMFVSEFNDYCPNGLQVEGRSAISKVATAVSSSLETIQQAVEAGVDALIVHHGMFWKGEPAEVVGVKKKKLELLIKNEISLIGYHLPLDAHTSIGNNWKVAHDLGWFNLTPCGYVNGKAMGVMGFFKPMTREAFGKQIEEYYSHPINGAFGGSETVESAYLISGGAYKYMSDAAKCGADCFITGNFDEPAWHDAHELGINFYAMGHSATERVGPIALCDHLKERFHVDTRFIDVYNPF
ncbi:MAG: Nif3-like dinuclear metal center hexameric protein [Chlamydiota bacterium]|nr:Nif3-like dinuclear metal center hexameric protein [Chlamydiota bacterium]